MKTVIMLILLVNAALTAGNDTPGSLSGRVTDKEVKSPLIGVNIYIKSTGAGATTDADGNYELKNVPVGLVTVVFSYIGYEQVSKTDIVIKPGRETSLNIEMSPSPVELATIEVSNGYFTELEDQPLSTTGFSSEEIRRSPGTAGDVSRILSTLPSVGKINDQRNSLIVRGGTAVENSFYLDNIEIPNINHFAVEGSSDGAIGIINADFIQDVNFYSGNFSPIFGDRLSSIMDISYREGGKSRFSPQINLNMAGVGGAVEGPIGENGNYLLSFNRSYLDLILNQIEEGAPLPIYSDLQGKLTFKTDENNRFSLLNILSLDEVNMDQKKAVDNDANMYGQTKGSTNTVGLNWQHIWNSKGYSNTSIAHTYINNNNEYFKTKLGNKFYNNTSTDNNIRLRNVNYFKLGSSSSIQFGMDLAGTFANYNTYYGPYDDLYGNTTPELTVDKKMKGYKTGLFGLHSFDMGPFNLSYGLRVDYFTFTENLDISPRATLTYSFSPATKVSVGAGLFHQNIPNNILAQSDEFKKLKTPEAVHYTAGFSHNLGNAARLSIEAYYKDYKNFPVNPEQPTMFLFDQVQTYGIFWSNQTLLDNGRADSKGIEMILQKKLAEDFYGIVSGSFSASEYFDYYGTKHKRIYDNRFNFNLEGGYIPDNEWEFKIRWTYAGGAPYTPFDYDASKAAGYGIWDLNRVNSERLPDYHSMNLRVDKKFNFETSNLLVYISVWNVYNRKNVAFYYWNEVKNDIDAQTQWSVLPVLGIEYEF